MHEKASEIEAILQSGERMAQRCLADEAYTEVARANAAAAARQEARDVARQIAERTLDDAAAGVRLARGRLVAARKEWRESRDTSRQLLAYRKVDALDASTWDDVEALAQEALELQDYDVLTAIVGKLPALLQRAREPLGPLAGKTGEIETLRRTLQQQIGALEPDTVNQARAALLQTEQNLAELRAGLASVNFRWARGGGPGPLRPSQQTQIEYHPKTGIARKFTGGRWP